VEWGSQIMCNACRVVRISEALAVGHASILSGNGRYAVVGTV
jgi:hypothetical protein